MHTLANDFTATIASYVYVYSPPSTGVDNINARKWHQAELLQILLPIIFNAEVSIRYYVISAPSEQQLSSNPRATIMDLIRSIYNVKGFVHYDQCS